MIKLLVGVRGYPVSPLVNVLKRDWDREIVEMIGKPAWTGGQTISRYAQAMKATGIAGGARVGLLSGNSVEVLIVHNAVGFTGACLVAPHPMGLLDDSLFAIEDGEIESLIYEPTQFSQMANNLLQQSMQLKQIYALGEGGPSPCLTDDAKTYEPGALDLMGVEFGPVTRLSYSGGTTGKPKAIPANPRTMGTAMQIMMTEWEWPVEPRVLAVAPLSHAGGALFGPTVLKGGRIFVLPRFDPEAVMKAIQDYQINCTMLVPTMIYALLDHPTMGKYDLSSLETVFYGASLMSPPRLKEAIEKIGPVFFQFYGQAEAPMSVMVLRRAEHDPNDMRRLASCGRPVPHVDVALMDDDMQPVADGMPGEICVRGPLVMDGYLDREAETRDAFEGGWLHTGDVAVKDPDGFYRIVDRKKDMIVSGGFNVFPSEVENVLCEHAAVAQAAVFGVPHEKWGEAVAAVVVLRDGASVSETELSELVKTRKGSVQAPKSIKFVDSIPQTPVGKPDKKALRVAF